MQVKDQGWRCEERDGGPKVLRQLAGSLEHPVRGFSSRGSQSASLWSEIMAAKHIEALLHAMCCVRAEPYEEGNTF